jgi:hypothetical protein
MDKGTFRSGLSEPEVVEVGSKKRANTIYEEVTAALDDSNKHEKDMKEMMLNQSKSAWSNYQFKARANSILVIIGVIILKKTYLKSISLGKSRIVSAFAWPGIIGAICFIWASVA